MYKISNYGEVYSHKKRKILKGSIRLGYITFSLNKDHKNNSFSGHRLVAIAFIPNPENKPQVNHKDANKSNNRVDNLEWATAQENMTHASENGLVLRSTPCCILDDDRNILKTYKSTHIFTREINQRNHNGSVWKACEGKIDCALGYRVRYYNEENNSFTPTRFDDESYSGICTRKQKILCNETGQIFESQNKASKELNISQTAISNYLSKKRKAPINGFTFKRI